MENEVLQRIKQFAGINKLNETELAKKVGIAQRTVNNYMNGKRKISFDFIIKIVTIFDLDANWLITGEGEMYKKEMESISAFYDHDKYIKILEDSIFTKKKYIEKLEQEIRTLKPEIAIANSQKKEQL